VVEEYCRLLRSYGIARVCGDKYAGEWPREQFKRHGVQYETAEHTKSEYYVDLLPLLNSRRIDLLDHARLVNQLAGLERRTSRAGKDSIDHPPGGHDDICNAVAGAAFLASQKRQPMRFSPSFVAWSQIPDRHGVASQTRLLMDSGHARPPPLPSSWPSAPAEPVLPRSPSFSASDRLGEMTHTGSTPLSEIINTINPRSGR
jgi:hypothetical protein